MNIENNGAIVTTNQTETETTEKKSSGKNSKDVYGATGKSNLLTFDPETLVLVTDPKHPLFDERVHLPVDEMMVRNIMHHGVLEPIVIRKNPENGDIEVVVGRQRVKCTREANKRLRKQGCATHSIPATVKRGEGSDLAGMMVSENEIRQDDTPLGRAKKAQRLLDMGKSEDEVAIYFGCSKATIKNMLSLLEAPAAVRNAVENGKITTTLGYQLAKLEPDAQKTALAEMLAVEAEPSTGGGKRKRSQKKRAALGKRGKSIRPRKEIEELRARVTDSPDAAFRALVCATLDWVLGGSKEPKIPKAAA